MSLRTFRAAKKTISIMNLSNAWPKCSHRATALKRTCPWQSARPAFFPHPSDTCGAVRCEAVEAVGVLECSQNGSSSANVCFCSFSWLIKMELPHNAHKSHLNLLKFNAHLDEGITAIDWVRKSSMPHQGTLCQLLPANPSMRDTCKDKSRATKDPKPRPKALSSISEVIVPSQISLAFEKCSFVT